MEPQYQISTHCTTVGCSSVAVQKRCNVTSTTGSGNPLGMYESLGQKTLSNTRLAVGELAHVRLTIIP